MKNKTTLLIICTLLSTLFKHDTSSLFEKGEPDTNDILALVNNVVRPLLRHESDNKFDILAKHDNWGTTFALTDHTAEIVYMVDVMEEGEQEVLLRSFNAMRTLPCDADKLHVFSCWRDSYGVKFEMADLFTSWGPSLSLAETTQALLELNVFDEKGRALLSFMHSALNTL